MQTPIALAKRNTQFQNQVDLGQNTKENKATRNKVLKSMPQGLQHDA